MGHITIMSKLSLTLNLSIEAVKNCGKTDENIQLTYYAFSIAILVRACTTTSTVVYEAVRYDGLWKMAFVIVARCGPID